MLKKMTCFGLSLALISSSFAGGNVGNFGTINGYEFKLPEYNGKDAGDISLLQINIKPEKIPAACPLEGVKYAKILEEMRRVSESYNTDCISRAENIVSNINSSITAGEQLQSQYHMTEEEIEALEDDKDDENDSQTNTDTDVTTETDNDSEDDSDDDSDDDSPSSFSPSRISPAQAKALQSGMNQLSQVISDKQCSNEFKEKGIMPILQSTIQSVSNIALLVPSSQSIAIGLSGSLINTTIDVFREMLKPKFQWDNEEDRKTFLRFNCAYINVKKLIEKEGVYELHDEKLLNQIERTKKDINHLNDLIKKMPIHYQLMQIEQERQQTLEETKRKREAEVKTYIFKEDIFTPFERIQSNLNTVITELKRLEKAKEKGFYTALTKAFTRIQFELIYMNEHIASQKPHAHLFFYVPMYTQIENTIKKLDPKTKAAEIMKLKKTDISGLIKELNIARRYHKSIHQESYKVARELVTPQEITDIINSIESDEEINKRFDLKYSYLRDTNSAAYAEEYVVKEKIDKTLLEKTDLLKKLQKQYRPQGEKLFTVHNAASADAKTIRDLDELNQNRIYGPTGYGLLRYTISESQNAIDVYKQNIQNLLEEMPQQDFKLLKNFDERVLYCNNIRKMKDIFADSQFPIELAYDFSVTNLPLIHNLYEKHFILEDERFEMRSQVFSALYAKALIDKYKDADDMQIDTIQDLRTASKVLEYSEKAKVCRYERTKKIGHHKDSHRKYKKVCWDEARKALPKGSIGREMIKLIEIEEKALQLQRSYNEYCRGDAAENLNPLHIKETSSEKEESAPAEVAQ